MKIKILEVNKDSCMKMKILENNTGKVYKNMKLYKFRSLGQNDTDYKRIIGIIENGFYCNTFLDFNDMNEGLYQHLGRKTPITVSEKNEYKICSFSGASALDCELMWGHYANAGKGVVIEVELNEDNIRKIVPVNYTDNLPDDTKLKDILSNKSTVWDYEDEYRFLSNDVLENNKVKIGKITKIYFGTPYKHLNNYKDIKANSKSLQQYLELKEKLKIYCKLKDVECVDYEFKSLNQRYDEILKRIWATK